MHHAEQTTPNASPSVAGTWKLDAGRTEIEFRTRSMWGLLPVRGSFRALSGYVEVSSAGEVEGRVEVDASSIATGMKVRDGHLRGTGFLEVEQHPRITFNLQQLDMSEGSTAVVGTIHARGASLLVNFPVSVTYAGSDQLSVEARFEVDRSLLGVTTSTNGANTMTNRFVVRAEFRRVDASTEGSDVA